jgi:hypothetical protein
MTAERERWNGFVAERRQRPTKGIVVIVDDRVERSAQLASELESYGYHAVTTRDLRAGVELASYRRTAAIIANSASGTEDGWSQLRRVWSNTQVILLGCDPPLPRIDACRQLLCLEQQPRGRRLRSLLDSVRVARRE